MRSGKDGSLPRPHWAKWDARWIPALVPYIKVGEKMRSFRYVLLRAHLNRNLDRPKSFEVMVVAWLRGVGGWGIDSGGGQAG